MLFEGSRAEADSYLRTISGRFYVYVLLRPDGRPFYVGKGVNRRALEHEAEARRHHPIGESNPVKCNVIRKIIREGGDVRYRIDSAYDPAEELACLEREAALILRYRRLHEGGCLTNLAGGLGNQSGSAPESLARHSATLAGTPDDNLERAILNRYLLSIGPVDSVPVKPLSQLRPIRPTLPHPAPRARKPRNAYALIASAAAHGLGIAPNVRIPRCFHYEGIAAIIENGVARDIVKAGVADLIPATDPRQEAFSLRERHVRLITNLVGRSTLEQRGLM